MPTGGSDIKIPTTLKDALDFLAKLYQLAAGDTIGKALEVKVQVTINFLKPVKVHLHLPLTEDICTNLNEVLQVANAVRNVIVKKGKHGRYHELDVKEAAKQCTGIFLKSLHEIYNTLFYLNIQRLAVRNEFVDDENAWLLVDDSDAEIRRCSDLLVNTMLQYVNTDILDALTQPVYMKHQNDELFGLIFDDLCELDIG
ncbi:ornithine/lysine/arginine decarboxylase [Babesia caballi]|uniref:Ornithine/lysine/arginine decarboxylase n=1 Tax=Babesia caballi TaxID=5871 RepID=A0AAV4LL24_BABCB|nr:ornithine/lysine/arginine decarboxylase [Babesia caballi]